MTDLHRGAARTEAIIRTEAIMWTALEAGQEIGYAKLGIEAIATRAGVGKYTSYRRWPSKGALERFIAPRADLTAARLQTAQDQGRLSPAFDTDLANWECHDK